jgi:mannose-1-phosphate guanylyltransferase
MTNNSSEKLNYLFYREENDNLISNNYEKKKNYCNIMDKSVETISEVFNRPWGYYQNLHGDDNSGFKVKKILVNKGCRLSLQSHEKRSEHWVITQGSADVQVGDEIFSVSKGIHIYIPTKCLHRLTNKGDDELILIETQIGSYLGEDDITRYDDDYGRK